MKDLIKEFEQFADELHDLQMKLLAVKIARISERRKQNDDN